MHHLPNGMTVIETNLRTIARKWPLTAGDYRSILEQYETIPPIKKEQPSHLRHGLRRGRIQHRHDAAWTINPVATDQHSEPGSFVCRPHHGDTPAVQGHTR